MNPPVMNPPVMNPPVMNPPGDEPAGGESTGDESAGDESPGHQNLTQERRQITKPPFILMDMTTNRQKVDWQNTILDICQIKKLAKEAMWNKWQQTWQASKGKAYFEINNKVRDTWNFHSKDRKIQRVLDSFRTGNVALNKYLFRQKLVDTEKCLVCDEIEDIFHFLCKCKSDDSAAVSIKKASQFKSEQSVKEILSNEDCFKLVVQAYRKRLNKLLNTDKRLRNQ